MRIAIGTAQFGLSYGVANESGQVASSEVAKILRLAKDQNIDLLDTAIAYGESERVLGQIGIADFRAVSKLPALPGGCANIELWVMEEVKSSLNRLGVPSLYGLLLHRSENLLGKTGQKIYDSLAQLKSSGLVKKVGVSIYDPSELDRVMGVGRIDIVQAPLNIIDRRLETSGWLSRLHREEVEVHTRSTFLQGLLVMPQNKIPAKFDRWFSMLDRWHAQLKKADLSATEVCLAYPLSMPEIDRVVVGVDSWNQLEGLVAASQATIDREEWLFMISNDQILINPSNWSTL